MACTILLVDDDRSVREALGQLLESEGYQTILAATGPEGIQVVRSQPVDLALLDLNLPEKDGWATFETLNSLKPDLPVIIITARSNQIFSALAAEAAALMEKPLDLEALLATIKNILDPSNEPHAGTPESQKSFHYSPPVRSES